jgi:sulfur-oxidizing protein SoxZ
MEPRVQAPAIVARGNVFQVKTLINHRMETGLRRDREGAAIPRSIVHSFTCRYNGALVFSVDLHEAMAANPYLLFYIRATESGVLQFMWEADDGTASILEKPLTVSAS